MGCIKSTEVVETPKEEEVYSWDRPENRVDPKDFTISDKTGGTFGRLPGTINGQQFIIENCKDTCIYLFDHSATITIDRCEDCTIFIGPSKGSVNVRNCTNCTCYILCQQFRSRECRKVNLYLMCDTQPIIESSSGMKFACLQFSYPQLEEQMKSAGLSVYNNLWYRVYDFTPLDQGNNWSLINVDSRKCLEPCVSEDLSSFHFSCEVSDSFIPMTVGKMNTRRFDDSALVVFFHMKSENKNENIAMRQYQDFLVELSKVTDYDIIQTKEIKLDEDDISRIFKQEKYTKLASAGPVISLELNGDNVIKKGEEVLEGLNISLDFVYISVNQAAAKQDIDSFYNFVEMSMNA